MFKVLRIALVVGILTALTQIGGVIWLLARLLVRDRLLRMATFVATYAAAMLSLPYLTDRLPVSGIRQEPLVAAHPIYPILLRNTVSPELAAVANDLARALEQEFPGTLTATLDGSFPFLEKFPLLPHLSHDDGEKLDLALFWTDPDGTYLPGKSKSPIGYFGYVEGTTDCAPDRFDLRWDMDWLQALLPARKLDEARTRAALQWLAKDQRVKLVFVEPHILARLGISDPKFRFQGCNAARHDDHIHIQL